jgi:hypothetical protein
MFFNTQSSDPIRRTAHGILVAVLMSLAAVSSAAEPAAAPLLLQSPSAFADITDREVRSKALFTEAGKVIQSPRCVNCHPAGDRPLQGDDGHLHLPAVVRGEDGHGAVGLKCNTCHQAENFAASGVPGNPKWHLAPLTMAWQGKSLGDICTQIKDPKRNGGRDLKKIEDHMAHDDLVGWAWNPGSDRTPAPGTQAQFGELITAWIQTGAKCPVD